MILFFLACGAVGDSAELAFPGDPDYVRDPALDVSIQSEAGSSLSHHTGEACMHCHQAHGNGRGQFTAAGSVYDKNGQPAVATIQFWSADGAVQLLEVPVDTLGNFYTTTDLGLPFAPVVPVVVVEGAEVNRMPWPTESASCNQCHTPVERVVVP